VVRTVPKPWQDGTTEQLLKRFGKAMMVAWDETLEEEEDSQEEEVVEALMARSESELDLESIESLSHLY